VFLLFYFVKAGIHQEAECQFKAFRSVLQKR